MITLIGYMGSGKSTLGKKLAEKLEYEYIDLDDEIEIELSKSISDIFKEYGDYYFRKTEYLVLKRLLNTKSLNTVLSTGGGAPTFYNAMNLINNYSTSIFLNVKLENLIERLEKTSEHRPLVANKNIGELEEFVKSQLQKRLPYYSKSHITVENNNLDDSLNRIITLYQKSK